MICANEFVWWDHILVEEIAIGMMNLLPKTMQQYV